MTIAKEEFLTLMEFPREWIEWQMLPEDNFICEQMKLYEPGNENASEHFRNGAFHWWIKRSPGKEKLIKLVKLSYLDPYEPMGSSVRKYISKLRNCDSDIRKLLDAELPDA